jgi:hypothetical protein
MDRYLCVQNNTFTQRMDVCYNHPPIHHQLSKATSGSSNYSYPSAHTSVHSFFAPMMPSSHPNVDTLLRNGRKYDSNHPNVDNYVNYLPANALCHNFSTVAFPGAGVCPDTVPSWHPALDASINDATKTYPANHVKTQPMMAPWMPSTHR